MGLACSRLRRRRWPPCTAVSVMTLEVPLLVLQVIVVMTMDETGMPSSIDSAVQYLVTKLVTAAGVGNKASHVPSFTDSTMVVV